MYHGMHEFMVYHKVPRNAVLHTFVISDFIAFVKSNAAVDRTLRLPALAAERRSYATKILPSFKSDNVALNLENITAMAQIARFLCLDAASPIEHVMHIVSDIIQGWAFTITPDSPTGWSRSAEIFADAMNDPAAPADIKGHWNMKLAFLDGVRWSRGDFNVRHKAERMRMMLTRAKRIGLEDPVKILEDELDAVRMNLTGYGKRQLRVLQRDTEVTVVDGPDEMGREEAEAVARLLMTPRSEDFPACEEIVYEEDGDDD